MQQHGESLRWLEREYQSDVELPFALNSEKKFIAETLFSIEDLYEIFNDIEILVLKNEFIRAKQIFVRCMDKKIPGKVFKDMAQNNEENTINELLEIWGTYARKFRIAPVEECYEDKSEKNAESVLTFWDFHTGTEAEVIENMIDEYNASQDKVKVEYSSVNQTDYTTTLVTTAYANGECPDILWVEPATFKKFTDADMLTDLTEYYSDDLKEDMLPSFLEAATGEDGKMYTLPFECETLGLFYDADLLEEAGVKPPKTWDELLEAAKKLTTDERYGIALPVEKTPYTLFNWWAFMRMAGADLYDDEGNVTAGSKEMVNAMEFWGEFYKKGYCPSSLQDGPWSIDNIANGVAAMQIGGTYMINAAEEYNKNGHNIQVVPLPSPDGKTSQTAAGGQMLGVCSQSENVEAAAEFIFSCFGSEDITYNTKWCTEAKFAYPTRQSVIEANQEVFEEGIKATFTEFYDTAVPEPVYSSEETDIMGDALQSIMFGGNSAEDAAKSEAEQLEALK